MRAGHTCLRSWTLFPTGTNTPQSHIRRYLRDVCTPPLEVSREAQRLLRSPSSLHSGLGDGGVMPLSLIHISEPTRLALI
eukprot:2259309-Alexandrium_andersonii.AAC.1